MTQEASDQAFSAFEEELNKAETEQLKRFKKLVDKGFLNAFKELFKISLALKDVLVMIGKN